MTTKLHDFFEFWGKLMDSVMGRIYPNEALKSDLSPMKPIPSSTSNIKQTIVLSQNTAPSVMPDHLTVFCTAIKNMEGANPANNNPGNCRCSPVGYLPKYGNVTCNPHNFAVFPTYELGWEYLKELVHHRVLLHPDWTFVDFFSTYAPSSDGNDPNHYANVVAKACGVSVDNRVSDYLSC